MAVTVTTGQPYYVRSTSGYFKGELTDLGTQSSVDCYFQYRIKSEATWQDTSANAETLDALGEFHSDEITLTENETYEVRSVATWNDGGAQYNYGSIVEFDAVWVREGSAEDFGLGELSDIEVVNGELALTSDGTYAESGTRQTPYQLPASPGDSTITWTADEPTDTSVTIEAQVQPTTEITDEVVGAGDGSQTIFTLSHWPFNTPMVKIDGTETVAFTVGSDRKDITFDTAPADGATITASYTAADDPVEGQPEIQELDLDSPSGGTFKLGDGTSWTSDIAYDASTAAIQTELGVLYGTGNVTVAEDTGAFIITFDFSVGDSNLQADFSGLT